MKRLFAFIFVILLLCPCFTACADVISTKEPTAEDTVYIAGNPDLYPLEFYNNETKCYDGILPKLYEEISRQTNINFSYVSANSDSRQKILAENCQVEMVSAYFKGDITTEQEIELFSYSDDGKTLTVCIGFTKIASPTICKAVTDSISSTNKNLWLGAAMKLEQKTDSSALVFYLLIAITVFIILFIILIVVTIKKRRAKKAELTTSAIDSLTGIGNLHYFEDCFSHHITEAMRPLYYVSYISIDIEKIETYFSTSQSEELQRYAASVITNTIKDNDFAARIGNGVFALCYMCPDTARALKTAEEIIDNLNAYNESYVKDNGIAFRCGVYPLSKQNIPCESVIYNARQGYLFANEEKLLVCLCDKSVLDRVSLKSRLQKKISSALENQEFQIYLQFIYDIKNQKYISAEVLSRWHSHDEGVLSPANYIEDMKLAGMIDKLDFYVFDKTCKLLSEWKTTAFSNLSLSCNFTRTTLSSSKFIKNFEAILAKYDFDRKKLTIELTEDSFADDSALAYKNVLEIKDQGCKVALDDFGSGYTSFSDLCDYPIDIIKIDRNFVAKSATSRGNSVLISVIKMAHSLGISVLCEGVETEAEYQKTVAAQSDFIQGFLYSRVLPLENALEFYEKKQN